VSKLTLTFACRLADCLQPLYAGEVQAEGIDLNMMVFPSLRQIFDRMWNDQEFDVAEMGLSDYITQSARGTCPFVAIPVFPSRIFRTGYICVNRGAGIVMPKDLEGRRVGVPRYAQSAVIWARGYLQHECGVDLDSIQWVQGSMARIGLHGAVENTMELYKAISVESNRTDRSLGQLLDAGELAATMGDALPPSFGKNPNIRRLFPNYRELERDYYRRTRIFPIMHLIALRRDVYERNPWIASNLYQAFVRSKDCALSKMRVTGAQTSLLPWVQSDLDEIEEIFSGDPWPYGIELNRATLQAKIDYLFQQGLIEAPLIADDLFLAVHDGHH
jgi:4,5-dihydroxyphthalate decarboxylase